MKNLQPDQDMVDRLRSNFSHELVAEELLETVKSICAAFGVNIKTEIVSVDKSHKVDVNTVLNGIPRMSAAMAAVYAGSHINPFKLVKDSVNNVKESPERHNNREDRPPGIPSK